jgi:molecular chaperone DnaJ
VPAVVDVGAHPARPFPAGEVSLLYGKKPFEVLGVSPSAEASQIRAAYRQRVKACHPDQYQDPEKQKAAQEALIELNLAYEEALKLCSQRRVGFNLVAQEEAKHFAARLVEQGNLESALRQLNRADSKDAEWFFIQGNILMGLRQYQTAHQSYREAVRREPENNRYRAGALDAAVEDRHSRQPVYRVMRWVEGVLHTNKK